MYSVARSASSCALVIEWRVSFSRRSSRQPSTTTATSRARSSDLGAGPGGGDGTGTGRWDAASGIPAQATSAQSDHRIRPSSSLARTNITAVLVTEELTRLLHDVL